MDALLAVLDGWSGSGDPGDDLETLRLELLFADRDHVEKRLERVSKQAKSGDASLRKEADDLDRLLAHLEAGNTLADWTGDLPGARAADDEAAPPARERRRAGSTASSSSSSPTCPRRRRRSSATAPPALGEVTRRLAEALGLISFFTAGEKETRAWTLRQGQTALEAADYDPLGHRARLHPRGGDPLGRPARVRLARGGRRRGLMRLEGKTYVVEDGDVLNIRFNV